MEYQNHVTHNIQRRMNQVILFLLKFYSFWNEKDSVKSVLTLNSEDLCTKNIIPTSNLKSTKKH